jgi:hypothetical protein
MRPLEIARAYIARTWSPVSIKYREKFPPLREWQTLRINHETAPQYFNGGPLNVGVILGKASNGLCDVDCDCAEALTVAPYLLPRTATIFGRAGRRHWHWLFQSNLAETRDVAVFEYDDPLCSKDKKAGIVELRIGGGDKGAQTVFPGFVHPSGEAIDWEEGGEPAEVDGERLHINVRKVAAAALLARYWPNGRRHDAALALGGMLAHSEWVEQQAKLFVEAVAKAAGDDEWRDRIKAVETSFAKFRAGGHVAGFPTLAELVDERVARRAGEWLDVLTVFGTRKAQGAARAAAAEGKNSEIVTEDSAAIQFAELHKAELRYCHDTGAWFRWDNNIWRQVRTGIAFQWARELARSMAILEPAKIRYTTSKISFAGGVERFARTDPVFAVTIDVWDGDPWLLGTPGGTVDLRTGEVRSAQQSDLITKTVAVAPAAPAECPTWRRFLEEATKNDAELIRFLQQWAGYCLTGVTREHALVFVFGPGGNGKTVFINVLTGIVADYATTAAMETFAVSHSDRHPTDLAMLRGARLVTASETEEGRAWAETRIKT